MLRKRFEQNKLKNKPMSFNILPRPRFIKCFYVASENVLPPKKKHVKCTLLSLLCCKN